MYDDQKTRANAVQRHQDDDLYREQSLFMDLLREACALLAMLSFLLSATWLLLNSAG